MKPLASFALTAIASASLTYAILQANPHLLMTNGLSSTSNETKLLGKTFLQGESIKLYENNKWAYEKTKAKKQKTTATTAKPEKKKSSVNCKTSPSLPVEYCLNTTKWQTSAKPSTAYEASYANKDKSLYMGVITEKVTVSQALFKNGILMLATRAAGGDRTKVRTLKDQKVTLNGQTWHYIEYTVDIYGSLFRYGNYYRSIGSEGSIQMVFYTTDSTFESLRRQIGEISQTLKVKN